MNKIQLYFWGKRKSSSQNCEAIRIIFFPIFFALLILSLQSTAKGDTNNKLQENFCATGSQQQLYDFFTEENYVVFARAKRIHKNGKTKDFSDTFFLVSPDMEFLHIVTQKKIDNSKFKACIFSSAREVDYRFTSPIPELLTEKNREHFLFLDEIPKNGECPPAKTNCIPWSNWSHMIRQTFLYSAYMYSATWNYDAYEEIVDLTLDGKTIHPTRGALAELARTKYAVRMRNELSESKEDQEAAKKVYKEIYNEVDHALPLMVLMLTDNRKWVVSVVDRLKGLVWTPMQGHELELYPLPRSAYEKFRQAKN